MPKGDYGSEYNVLVSRGIPESKILYPRFEVFTGWNWYHNPRTQNEASCISGFPFYYYFLMLLGRYLRITVVSCLVGSGPQHALSGAAGLTQTQGKKGCRTLQARRKCKEQEETKCVEGWMIYLGASWAILILPSALVHQRCLVPGRPARLVLSAGPASLA